MSNLSYPDQADEDAEKSQVQERLNLRIGCQSRKLSSFFSNEKFENFLIKISVYIFLLFVLRNYISRRKFWVKIAQCCQDFDLEYRLSI